MKLKSVLGSSAELGVALVAVTALVVAGCGGGSKSSANTATPLSASMSSYINDGLAGNLISWKGWARTSPAYFLNASGVPVQSGVIATSGVDASITTYAATAANTYTSSGVTKSITLPGGTWTVTNTGAASGVTQTDYMLTSSGWTLTPATNLVANGNSFTYFGMPGASLTPTKIDLSGQAVACGNPMDSTPAGGAATFFSPAVSSVPCAVATIYPAGASQYSATATYPTDMYSLYDLTGPGTVPHVLTDGAGVALTSFPAVGTTFCVNGYVYVPIVGALVGADNYSLKFAISPSTFQMSCAAADIVAATSFAGFPSTALVSNKVTGMAGVSVLSAVMTMQGMRYDVIYAFNLGKVMSGSFVAADSYPIYEFNKLAVNAQLTANGFPVLP